MVAHGLAIAFSALLFPLWSTVAILVVGLIAQVSWAMFTGVVSMRRGAE